MDVIQKHRNLLHWTLFSTLLLMASLATAKEPQDPAPSVTPAVWNLKDVTGKQVSGPILFWNCSLIIVWKSLA